MANSVLQKAYATRNRITAAKHISKMSSAPIPDSLQEKGWTIIIVDDPTRMAEEGEQYHAIDQVSNDWFISKAGFNYPKPVYVRYPSKVFNPKVWCEKCELPEEDCSCQGGPVIDMSVTEENIKLASQGYLLSTGEDEDAEYVSTPSSNNYFIKDSYLKNIEEKMDKPSKQSWWQKLFS